jgi:CubicO group peptidase (beta-lactamase class C family)
LTAATKYRIASITKMFTTVMILQLVEEGKLKPTDTLDKFSPQIPNANRITIAQILTHRSGIHDLEADGSWGMQPRTREEVVARIAQGKPDFEPDTKHGYSNAAYILLGYVVEKAGGKPYAEASGKESRRKSGSRIPMPAPEPATPTRTKLCPTGTWWWREAAEVHFSVLGGAGSIVSTPADIAKFSRPFST